MQALMQLKRQLTNLIHDKLIYGWLKITEIISCLGYVSVEVSTYTLTTI